MTVNDLFKRLKDEPLNKMITFKEDLHKKGWSNINIHIENDNIYIYPDKEHIFNR